MQLGGGGEAATVNATAATANGTVPYFGPPVGPQQIPAVATANATVAPANATAAPVVAPLQVPGAAAANATAAPVNAPVVPVIAPVAAANATTVPVTAVPVTAPAVPVQTATAPTNFTTLTCKSGHLTSPSWELMKIKQSNAQQRSTAHSTAERPAASSSALWQHLSLSVYFQALDEGQGEVPPLRPIKHIL